MKLRIHFFALLFALLLIMQSNRGGRNQATTGAPFESSVLACAQCHGGGSAFNPTIDISLKDENNMVVNKYRPGSVYDVEIKFSSSSGSPANYGFQTVMVDKDNNQAGEVLTLGEDVRKLTITSKTYLTQTKPRADGIFKFQWKASDVDSIKIYTAGIATNNNGGTNGDKSVRLISKIEKDLSSFVNEEKENIMSYKISDNHIYFDNENTKGEIYNLSGLKIQNINHGESLKVLNNGIYVLKYWTISKNKAFTTKFHYFR